jgi:hypothetical protein
MNKYAIVVDPHDNVAVVKKEVPLGTTVMLDGGHSVSVKTTVPIGNRFATRANSCWGLCLSVRATDRHVARNL